VQQDVTAITKGLHRGLRTGLRVGWKRGGKPVLSKFVRLPFRDEAAELITSLWQRGAGLGEEELLGTSIGWLWCRVHPCLPNAVDRCRVLSIIRCAVYICTYEAAFMPVPNFSTQYVPSFSTQYVSRKIVSGRSADTWLRIRFWAL